jgi:TrpR family trp operon transcriptional repressor
MRKNYKNDILNWEIIKVLSKIKNPKLMALFLKDLLTQQELVEIKRRWQIINLLDSGLPQRSVAKKLKIAIATVSRGSRMLKNPQGGFNQILKNKFKYSYEK